MFVPRTALLHHCLFLNLALFTPLTRASHAAASASAAVYYPPKRTSARTSVETTAAVASSSSSSSLFEDRNSNRFLQTAQAAASAYSAFVPTAPPCGILRDAHRSSRRGIRCRRPAPRAIIIPSNAQRGKTTTTMTTTTTTTTTTRAMTAKFDENHRAMVDQLSSIALESIIQKDRTGCCSNDDDDDEDRTTTTDAHRAAKTTISGAIRHLRNLTDRADSTCNDDDCDGNDESPSKDGDDAGPSDARRRGAAACAVDVVDETIEEASSSREEEGELLALLHLLARDATTSVDRLGRLVRRANSSRKVGYRKSSGQAWKALESVVSSVVTSEGGGGGEESPPAPPSKRVRQPERDEVITETTTDACDDGDDDDDVRSVRSEGEISRALAFLAVGIALALNSAGQDPSTAKMVASAVIPSDRVHVVFRHNNRGGGDRGKKYRKREEESKRATATTTSSSRDGAPEGTDDAETRTVVRSMANAAVVGLLRLALDAMKKKNNNGGSSSSSSSAHDEATTCSVDLQIVSKLESGFCVGELGRTLKLPGNVEAGGNEELGKAVADVVDVVFGRSGASSTDRGGAGDKVGDDYMYGVEGELMSKELIAPTFALVANARPWDHVQVEKLVTCAAELDLWYSAELLCDAAVASTTRDENKVAVMATSLPKGATTEEFLPTDGQRSASDADADNATSPPPPPPPPPRDSIGALAAGAIIDVTFDYRLYKRADAFASKYYAFGGPERFAEARFLHACDTIAKLVKRRQVSIIERQVERVDASVERARGDLMGGGGDHRSSRGDGEGGERRRSDGDCVAIENMSQQIREYTLRHLRVSNQHAAVARFANLWDMRHDHDPVKMAQELEERKLLYLQWDDAGCPGDASGGAAGEEARPAPDLIAEPADLLERFVLLENNPNVGFDCEWHDSIRGVAVLQLSTVADAMLLDIPALTAAKEGCDALRATVGKLFTRSGARALGVRRVVGFGCKDDIKRLRASPCATEAHWFPQDRRCEIEDLRVLIRELNPQLGGKGGMHFGLSRACEMFLDKQLDKCEQCSDWLARPLSPEQREYAALDAWSCAAIAAKIDDGKGQVKLTETKDEAMLLK